MSDELKPCPFCGEQAEFIPNAQDFHVIQCAGQCVVDPWVGHDESTSGITEWNTRPIEDAMRVQLRERDERIAELDREGLRQAEQIVRLCDALVYVEGILRRAGREVDPDADLTGQITAYVGELEARAEAAERESERLIADNDRLRRDRYDALSVTSKDGLLASEWVARTGKAERERDEAKQALSEAEEDGRKIRRLLCMALAGSDAYMDDGEASDTTKWPYIDFIRDSANEIERKLRERGLQCPRRARPGRAADIQTAERWR